jgi:ABC-type polysaccharide/polyol phosphate export permease
MPQSSIASSHSYRDLLVAWTSRIIRARYQQSILGGLWAVVQPLATVAVFTVIFTYFIPINTGDIPYAVFSYTAMAPWLLFSTSMMDMTESLVTNMNLVTKIYFPREIFAISALMARIRFCIAYLVLFVLIWYYQLPVSVTGLVYPAYSVDQLLSLGLGPSALANVFYRDIKHVVTLIIQLWFYATIIYRLQSLKWNPLSSIRW